MTCRKLVLLKETFGAESAEMVPSDPLGYQGLLELKIAFRSPAVAPVAYHRHRLASAYERRSARCTANTLSPAGPIRPALCRAQKCRSSIASTTVR